jgi:acyl-CoA synthetase (AMP-forming)/AMP-acid ligase II
VLPTARLTLADVVRSYARSRADALCLGDGDVRLSWRETDIRTNRVANALRHAGVGNGDRVLWLGQNSFRLQELLIACAKLGAMFCPANWRQGPEELAFVIDDLEPRVVVGQHTEVGEAIAAARDLSSSGAAARWLWHDVEAARDAPDAPDAYETFVAEAGADATDPELDGSSDDALLLVYTAAFSGRPNAAMLSSRALLAQGTLMAPWQGIDESSVFLNSGPLFHIGTFMPNLSAFAMGGANVFVARSDGDAMCTAIASFGCTSGFLVGPMVDAVVAANAELSLDLSTFRGHRGNPAFDAMVQPDLSAWGRNAGGYGQTEVMGMATFNLLGDPRAGIGTHGRPSPLVQIKIVGEDGHEQPVGSVGEIAVRGTTVMNGYWNRPELNAERGRNGWHHTNDLGRYETDGTFSFIAPKGRMLKSAAENIYPAEVENAVRSHPAVADCAVIGVPDDTWVQAVKAVVVVAEGREVTGGEIIEWCRSRIASYKKPRTVEFVETLPRAGFFVDYDALDRRFGGGNYPGGGTRSA